MLVVVVIIIIREVILTLKVSCYQQPNIIMPKINLTLQQAGHKKNSNSRFQKFQSCGGLSASRIIPRSLWVKPLRPKPCHKKPERLKTTPAFTRDIHSAQFGNTIDIMICSLYSSQWQNEIEWKTSLRWTVDSLTSSFLMLASASGRRSMSFFFICTSSSFVWLPVSTDFSSSIIWKTSPMTIYSHMQSQLHKNMCMSQQSNGKDFSTVDTQCLFVDLCFYINSSPIFW